MKKIGWILVLAAFITPAWLAFDYYQKTKQLEYLKPQLAPAERDCRFKTELVRRMIEIDPANTSSAGATEACDNAVAIREDIELLGIETRLAALRGKLGALAAVVMLIVGTITIQKLQ